MNFQLNNKELIALDAFIAKHKKCSFTSTTGGKFTYEVTPTGLGSIVKVRCNACGVIKDITDTTCW